MAEGPIAPEHGNNPTAVDFKHRHALLIDKASIHTNSKKQRTGLVSEKIIQSEYTEDILKTFNGQPHDSIIDIANLYGFDLIVLPTRSFDKDPLDCGIFASVKMYIRRHGWRVRTARGMARSWERAWAKTVTKDLIQHCCDRAGIGKGL